ncbi:tetratricopeptide repeat protein, partial [Planctomycetota bacterium]
YIEVQSGPLPTQSDYGMLWPRDEVSWQEWWFPVHGLGDGFEFASKDIAVQAARDNGKLTLSMIATGKFSEAACTVSQAGQNLLEKKINLSPKQAKVLEVSVGDLPVRVEIKAKDGTVLASFTTLLPIPEKTARVIPEDKPDEELTVEETYLKALKFDRGTRRGKARKYYEMALEDEPHHLPSLRGLAVLDIEAGLYKKAIARLEKALEQKPNDDGLCWYFLGLGNLRTGNNKQALDCAYRAVRCFGTESLGYDLAGRVHMRNKEYSKAADDFTKAVRANPKDRKAQNHFLLALYALDKTEMAWKQAKLKVDRNPTDLTARAIIALQGKSQLNDFVQAGRDYVGEDDFEMLETGLTFAEIGLYDEAVKLILAFCIEAVDQEQVNPLPLYYLAYFSHLNGDDQTAQRYLGRAAGIYRDFVFPSRAQAVEGFKYALEANPSDAYAHLHLGNLYANLGRLDEAVTHWSKAGKLDELLNVAFRNLGFYTWVVKADHSLAADYYLRAIKARPLDQTLYRDLAEVLIDNGKIPEAIRILETMPFEGNKRSDIIILLARAYVDNEQYTRAIELLAATPYFVNWEGSSVTKDIFDNAHIKRGLEYFDNEDYERALADFDAALTYPENLGSGRKDKLQEAKIYYWRGKCFEELGRMDQARTAWKIGAEGQEGSKEQNEHRQLCSMALLVTK